MQESQKETESRSVQKSFEDFIEKLKKSMPDPIVSTLYLYFYENNLKTLTEHCSSTTFHLHEHF
jgi:vacuolar-type H+-ATPase subunit C/Vma6